MLNYSSQCWVMFSARSCLAPQLVICESRGNYEISGVTPIRFYARGRFEIQHLSRHTWAGLFYHISSSPAVGKKN